MSPCPRRPSPDTASTFALVQGQQEGDKRRAQARAQVPDAAPTPVNHTSRTRQSLHHGLPSALLFWYPLPLTSHFHSLQEYGGGFVSCSGHCHWGTLSIEIPPQPWLAFLTKVYPCRRSPNLGRIADILRASKPRKRHRLGEGKRLCANAALVPRGTDGHGLQVQPTPPPPQGILHPDKDSVWSAPGSSHLPPLHKTISDICPI